MRSTPLVLVAGAVALSVASIASADVATLISSRDNTIIQSATGNLSNGAGPSFFVGKTTANSIRRGVLRFDFSTIPAGATVTSVSLTLNCSQAQGGASTIELHRSLADWGEGSSSTSGGGGAPAQPGDATWLHTFYSSSFWASQGGDFSPTVSASQVVPDVGVYTWSSATLASDVQSWIDGSASNFGWFVLGDESAVGTAKRFDTRENTAPAVRPTLRVEYAIPTPGAAMIVGAAGLVGLGRRRSR